jgi:hypothetical protein
MAMREYKKAADGGNCLAMMAIGDLYSNGHGVPADKTEAQSWHAKAQSCQDGNLALLQQQLARYRARAAAAREPMLAAIPVIPNPFVPRSAPVAVGNRSGSGFSVNRLLAGIVTSVVIVAAVAALVPASGHASSDSDPFWLSHTMDNTIAQGARSTCIDSGGTPGNGVNAVVTCN